MKSIKIDKLSNNFSILLCFSLKYIIYLLFELKMQKLESKNEIGLKMKEMLLLLKILQ